MNQGGSIGDGFTQQVDLWVHQALDTCCHTFSDLVRRLPGVYPTAVAESLRRLAMTGRIPLLPAARLVTQSKGPVWSGVSSLACDGLPVPHPLDFDWRFSDEAVERILAEATLLSSHRGSLGVVGAPSVGLEAARSWTPGKVSAYDINPGAVSALGRIRPGIVARRCNILTDVPPRARLDVVVTDPPWYSEDLCSSLRFCHAICRSGGFVLASLPPVGTRPGIAQERAELVEFAARLGLDLVRVEPARLSYRSPPFEQNALRAAGVPGTPVDWRRADAAVFRKTGSPTGFRPIAPECAEVWDDVSFPTARVKVRAREGRGFSDPRLSSIVEGDILPTVSRRDPRREDVGEWTSGNRVFACGGSDTLLVVARAVASGQSPLRLVAGHLGRPLRPPEADMIAEAEAQLTRVVLIEARELAAYAVGPRENRRGVFAS